MFLHELKYEEQKDLFIGLAALIMMVVGSEETTTSNVESSDSAEDVGNMIDVFWENIDDNEMNMLKQYDDELDELGPAFDTLHDILDDRLEEQITQITQKYSQNEDFKKELIERIVSDGVDILKITPEIITKMMINIPAVQQDILESTAISFITSEDDELLSAREKKIILFELIGAGFSSGSFEVQEKQLLAKVCAQLGIDNEYIEEFTEVASRLFDVNKEINDLINE